LGIGGAFGVWAGFDVGRSVRRLAGLADFAATARCFVVQPNKKTRSAIRSSKMSYRQAGGAAVR